MREIGLILLVGVAVAACDKAQAGTAASAAPPTSPTPAASTSAAASATASSTPVALTAEPAFGEIKPSKKAPFDAVRFRMRGERGAEGWPEYDAANLSDKAVTYLNVYGYAYDKDEKQVGRSKPLGWSDELAPGKSLPIRVGRFEDKVSAAAVTFELCYTTIRFQGEKKETRDDERCPEQKAKSK